jgi:hypothetical protein
MKYAIPILLAFILGASAGCYYDNNQELHPELLFGSDPCDTSGTISYAVHIRPILSGSCGANNACHSGGSAGGGIVLAQYAGVKAAADNGKLWSAIIWDGNASRMPKNSASQINDCYQAQIRKWLDQGAPDN